LYLRSCSAADMSNHRCIVSIFTENGFNLMLHRGKER
jgi:hypothetical protein